MKKDKKIEDLIAQRLEIQTKLNNIYEKAEKKRSKQLEDIVGCCMKHEYSSRFRKIIDYVVHEELGLHLVIEEIGIDDNGFAKIEIISDIPHVNREWKDKKIPLYGWTEEITEKEYEKQKKKVISSLNSCKKVRDFLASIVQ